MEPCQVCIEAECDNKVYRTQDKSKLRNRTIAEIQKKKQGKKKRRKRMSREGIRNERGRR